MASVTQAEAVAAAPMRELTLRAVVLGGLITLVFTAANVYLGLRIGLTFATSIPAAVISMAVLRLFPSSTILENNIVQTVASAAGTLAAIIFVLPGLVIIGWWSGFPYWMTAAATALGGILGVMFSVPLRRALVVDTPLPYPEGVAAAEVLKCGAGSREGDAENEKGLRLIIVSSLASALFTLRRQDPPARRGGGALFPCRHGLDRHFGRPFLRPGRRRPSRRHLGRHGDAAGPRHQLVDSAADPHGRPAGHGGSGRQAPCSGRRCASLAPA